MRRRTNQPLCFIRHYPESVKTFVASEVAKLLGGAASQIVAPPKIVAPPVEVTDEEETEEEAS